VEAWFVASPDQAHVEALVAGLDAGVALFVEKPVVTDAGQFATVVAAAAARRAVVQVAHVLRYAPLHRRLHDVVAEGDLGEVISVAHTENVAATHFAHSYVRGQWSRAAQSSPLLLAKACHDLDLLAWNLPAPVVRVSSFGSLVHFRPERSPAGATDRCVDGCPVTDCAYDARRQYLGDHLGWPVHVIADDLSPEGRLAALRTGPYGRCVYTAGSDVVDNQIVAMELGNGATVTLRVHGHAPADARSIRYDGTRATARAYASEDRQHLEVIDHRTGVVTEVRVDPPGDVDPHGMGHGGGDEAAVAAFARAVRHGEPPLTSIADSVASHVVAFAAEHARRTGTVVDVDEFWRRACAPLV
jgi:predicted dehydrogenase